MCSKTYIGKKLEYTALSFAWYDQKFKYLLSHNFSRVFVLSTIDDNFYRFLWFFLVIYFSIIKNNIFKDFE